MRRLRLDQDIKPLAEFQAHAEALLEEIRETRRALLLTQEGRSAAVVIDVTDFETLLEELETLREIHLAEQQLAAGQGVPHEEAREQILSGLDR
jgi:antitoxin YefM